jgi:hypothetical protein
LLPHVVVLPAADHYRGRLGIYSFETWDAQMNLE